MTATSVAVSWDCPGPAPPSGSQRIDSAVDGSANARIAMRDICKTIPIPGPDSGSGSGVKLVGYAEARRDYRHILILLVEENRAAPR